MTSPIKKKIIKKNNKKKTKTITTTKRRKENHSQLNSHKGTHTNYLPKCLSITNNLLGSEVLGSFKLSLKSFLLWK